MCGCGRPACGPGTARSPGDRAFYSSAVVSIPIRSLVKRILPLQFSRDEHVALVDFDLAGGENADLLHGQDLFPHVVPGDHDTLSLPEVGEILFLREEDAAPVREPVLIRERADDLQGDRLVRSVDDSGAARACGGTSNGCQSQRDGGRADAAKREEKLPAFHWTPRFVWMTPVLPTGKERNDPSGTDHQSVLCN